ncbi:hypothetical protein BGZ63DRAFT_421815 [Mariannaea sp. PMI_226]|nr:hypothetical protein BGZ63DRAFT_421815 [Mariannaea sp. PMI_226]
MSSFPAYRNLQPRRGSRETSRSLDFTSSFAMNSPYSTQLSCSRGSRRNVAEGQALVESLTPGPLVTPGSQLGSRSPGDVGDFSDIAPRKHSMPASLTPSTTMTSPSQPLLPREGRRRSSTMLISPESLNTDIEGYQTSVEPRSSLSGLATPASTRPGLALPRSASAETVRGPTTSRHYLTPPLTRFPPWAGDSDGDCECGQRDRDRTKRSGLSVIGVEGRWLLNCIMHAMVLAMQFIATLVVLSALMWMAVWQKSDEDVEFWEWLWQFAEPSLVGILLVCSATLLAHEVRILSSVALLFLQCAILFLTTLASIFMWIRCIGEYNSTVKGLLMGCNVLIWGLSLFGFMRAVVIWKVEMEMDEERMPQYGGREPQRVSYGTFVPWYESFRDPQDSS